jgi:hypothetical protein
LKILNAPQRGMRCAVRQGLLAGGNCYGYTPVPGQPSERTINEAEAAIVRRVFAEYLGDASPRSIAAGLNADGVPSARGRVWGASAIHGNPKLGFLITPVIATIWSARAICSQRSRPPRRPWSAHAEGPSTVSVAVATQLQF